MEAQKLIKNSKAYKNYIPEKENVKLTSNFNVLNKKYSREINKNYLLLLYIQHKGFLVVDFQLGTVFCFNFKLERFVCAIEIVIHEPKQTLIGLFGDKKGNLFLIRCKENRYEHLFFESVH